MRRAEDWLGVPQVRFTIRINYKQNTEAQYSLLWKKHVFALFVIFLALNLYT